MQHTKGRFCWLQIMVIHSPEEMLDKLSTSLGFTRRTKSIAYSKGYWVSDTFGMPGYRPDWITQSSVIIIIS